MGTPLLQIDAFTDGPFRGNPAAVCLLGEPREESWMQALAEEMNLSETAFLWPESEELWRLRWFTPEVEVSLCGHATLAAAHALWETGRLPRATVARFATRSGILSAVADGDWIEMDFPEKLPEPCAPVPELADALGARPLVWTRAGEDLLVELATEGAVRALDPDFHALDEIDTRGIIVTARGDGGADHDFVSRFFAPHVGIDEDPVTGSAHCGLAPYWADRLGRRELTGYQASARGGIVRVRHVPERRRVAIAGKAVTVLDGELAPAVDQAGAAASA
jgi:PhzF family phenazine biosynthesis protein